MGPFLHILAPTDFSEPARRAVRVAIDLALAFDAKLTLVHAYEIPGYAYTGVFFAPVDLQTPVEAAARSLLNAALEEVRKRMPSATAELRCGAPWEEIIATAEAVGADLIVIGTHGRGGIARALLGSVSEKVVRHAPLPVLTIRTPVP